jgi:5-methylcytosine-specific restriction endonuclease McrA
MKIGKLVQANVEAIFAVCEQRDPDELSRLQCPEYARRTFGLAYPFCRPAEAIGRREHARYWTQTYDAAGARLRVTNDWYEAPLRNSRVLFIDYCQRLGLSPLRSEDAASCLMADDRTRTSTQSSRYRGNAIGNAQNLVVRNLLSRLGQESFSRRDWENVVRSFGNQCAYCGTGGKLIMEHAVPINKDALGEHRLGNLVPSCPPCNTQKADKDYRSFLSDQPARRAAIEEHMARHRYTPLSGRSDIAAAIARAHGEVRDLADRYAVEIERLLDAEGP